jgi:hypothetical protein
LAAVAAVAAAVVAVVEVVAVVAAVAAVAVVAAVAAMAAFAAVVAVAAIAGQARDQTKGRRNDSGARFLCEQHSTFVIFHKPATSENGTHRKTICPPLLLDTLWL